MERISVRDLNNLSGNSIMEIDEVYNAFREAHKSLLNKANQWVSEDLKFSDNHIVKTQKKYTDKYAELYWEGNLLNIDIGCLLDTINEFQRLLEKVRYKKYNNIWALKSMLTEKNEYISKQKKKYYDAYAETQGRLEDLYE